MRTPILICSIVFLAGCSNPKFFGGGSDDSPIVIADSGAGTTGIPGDRLRELNLSGNYYTVCHAAFSSIQPHIGATIHDSGHKLTSFQVESPSPQTYPIQKGQNVTLTLTNSYSNPITSSDLQIVTISFTNGTWNTAIPNTAVSTDGALTAVDLDLGAGKMRIYTASAGSSFKGCFHYKKGKDDAPACTCSQ